MRVSAAAFCAVLATGCLATKSDLQAVAQQQAQLSMEVVRMQDHLADLTMRNQGLTSELRELKGELTVVEANRQPLEQELKALQERLANLETRTEMRLKLQSNLAMPAGATTASDPMAWNDAAEAYGAAVSSLREGRATAATRQLLELLTRWPEDEYAVQAQVKLGESLYAQVRYLDAIERYLEVIENNPQSRWVPQAYLDLAYALLAIEQRPQARQVLTDVGRLYPDTGPAIVADHLLAVLFSAPAGPAAGDATAPATAATPATAPPRNPLTTGTAGAAPTPIAVGPPAGTPDIPEPAGPAPGSVDIPGPSGPTPEPVDIPQAPAAPATSTPGTPVPVTAILPPATGTTDAPATAPAAATAP